MYEMRFFFFFFLFCSVLFFFILTLKFDLKGAFDRSYPEIRLYLKFIFQISSSVIVWPRQRYIQVYEIEILTLI